MAVADITARINKFEVRQSKNGEYVSLTLTQDGVTLYASAFDAASIDGDAVVLPSDTGVARFTAGDLVTARVRVSAYTNAKGRSYASFTVLSAASAA